MTNVMFQFNQQAAMSSRESFGITESGAYVGKLSAKWVQGSNGSKSAGIEFSLECDQGKLNYLTAWYQKKDGTCNDSVFNLVNAMMGLLKIQQLTSKQVGDDWVCPEFDGKQIGLVVQKELFTKNSGGEGYKFEIIMPFSAQSRKTLKEAMSNSPATAVDKMLPLLKTKDNRSKAQGYPHVEGQQQSVGFGDVPSNFDDDIPFAPIGLQYPALLLAM